MGVRVQIPLSALLPKPEACELTAGKDRRYECVVERFKTLVLKTRVLNSTAGSNPAALASCLGHDSNPPIGSQERLSDSSEQTAGEHLESLADASTQTIGGISVH